MTGPLPCAVGMAASGATTTPGAGAGSLWNPGSWHWDARSYDRFADETLRQLLLSVVTRRGVWELRVVSVKRLTAEATVHLRKGAKLPVFDVTAVCVWEGRATDGSTGAVVSGEASLSDVMPDDVEGDFAVAVTLSGGGSETPVKQALREVMRVAGAAEVSVGCGTARAGAW